MPALTRPSSISKIAQDTQLYHWLTDAPRALPLTTGSRGKWLGLFVIIASIMGLSVSLITDPSPQTQIIDILDVVSLLLGVGIYIIAEKIPRVGINVIVLGCTTTITIEVSIGYSARPANLAIVFYVWVALYVFSFLSTAESLGHVGYIIVAYTVALILGARPHEPLADWILIISTVVIASISSGYLNYTIRQLAITDSMTSASNRKGWDLVAPREINRARRNGGFVVVAMIDMDGFKEINDTHGHPMGDQILIDTAKAIRQSVRPFDVVARWGGDEFAFMGLVSNRDEAKAFIERVVTNVQKVSPLSCGAVVATPDHDIDNLISAADDALYRSKGNSNKRFHMVYI
ncbi:GGDEF domain-containing protein [Acidithrix sp. C25]|uniref:GGDEF domain-containing protein n=1 Tax=Acidithrix sp. C25 TaxID=1671482 RepID=UPI00191BBC95|nr:GGDEF domain-containing protein [Acidithrix sp. C25]